MSSFRALGKDIFAYGLLGGISRSAHLILLPILTRHFSTGEYGVIDVIAAMSSLLAVLMSVNLESAVARMWFDAEAEKRQAELVSSVLALVSCAGALLLLPIVVLSRPVSMFLLHSGDSSRYVILGATGALLSALSVIPQIVLRMQRRILAYNVVTSFQTVGYVALALILVVARQSGLVGVFIAQVGAAALALVVGLLWTTSYLSMRISRATAIAALKYSAPLLPAVAATWVTAQADRVVLLTFGGLGAVGVFGVASRVAMALGLLVSVVQQAWVPMSISMVKDRTGRDEFYSKALNLYAGALAIVALVMTAFAKEVIALIAPAEYQGGYVVVPWLAGAQVLYGSGAFTNLGMLVSKRTVGNSIAAWIGTVINIAVCLLLIPRIGINGAAAGAFVSALVFTIILWRFSVRVADVRFAVRPTLAVLFCYVAACACILLVCARVKDAFVSIAVRGGILALSIVWMTWWTVNATGVRPHVEALFKRSRAPSG